MLILPLITAKCVISYPNPPDLCWKSKYLPFIKSASDDKL